MREVEIVSKLPTASDSQIGHRLVDADSIIKPCPFCGNTEPELVSESQGMHFELGTGYIVRCNFLKGGCGARSGSREEKEDAIIAWNKRS